MPDSRRISVALRESNPTLQNGKGRVDRVHGLIRSVKILGQKSSNGRLYLADTIRKAAHLYENKSVRLDHPDKPEDQRPVESVIGSLVNVRVGPDGDLYGDLRVVKAHPFASRLFEMAESQPHLVSLSHNAEGSCDHQDGTLVVYEITEVRSVDLVTDGATTSSLFESRQFDSRPRRPVSSPTRTRAKPTPRGRTNMATSLREWFERIPLLVKDRKNIKRLFEAGAPMAGLEDMPMEDDLAMDNGDDPITANPVMDDPADQSADDALQGGFNRACHIIIDDTTIPSKDKVRRLKEIITAAERMISAGEEIPEADGDPVDAPDEDLGTTAADKPELDGDADNDDMLEGGDRFVREGEDEDMLECDDEKVKSMYESKNPKLVAKAKNIELARLKRKEKVRDLCESQGYTPDAIDFKALCALSKEEDRLDLIETRKAAQPRRVRTTVPVTESRRTQTPTTPVMEASQIKDGDTAAFAKYVTGGLNGAA